MKDTTTHFLIPPGKSGKNPDRIFGCNYALFFQQNIIMLYPATLLQREGYDIKVTDCAIDGKTPEQGLQECEHSDVTYVFHSVFLSRENDMEASEYIENNRGREMPMADITVFYPRHLRFGQLF